MKKEGFFISVSREHFCIAFFEMLTMLTVVLTGMNVRAQKDRKLSSILTIVAIRVHGKRARELKGQSPRVHASPAAELSGEYSWLRSVWSRRGQRLSS